MILDVLIQQLTKIRNEYGGDIEIRVAPTNGETWPQENYFTREAFLYVGRDWEDPYVCLDYDPTSNRIGISNEERMRELLYD